MFNMCENHYERFDPQLTNYQFKLNIKQSKPNKITFTAEIKWQRLREERCKHKENIAMCYRRGN